MLSVCETAACRCVLLLKHFGEESEPCGHCDNCLHPPAGLTARYWCKNSPAACTAADNTLPPVISPTLRGKSDDWILRNGHDKLSTFGIGNEQTDKEWRSVICQCISLGYLTVNVEQHQALQLTEAAKQVPGVLLKSCCAPCAAKKQPPKAEKTIVAYGTRRAFVAGIAPRRQITRPDRGSAGLCGLRRQNPARYCRENARSLEDLHQIYGLASENQ